MQSYNPSRKYTNYESTKSSLKSTEKENFFFENQPYRKIKDCSLDLDSQKLTDFLKNYETFPDKHRIKIWGFLLNLPNNENEFEKLSKMGHHEFFKGMTFNLEPK